jgi:ABC-type phosphate transport system substrate-binding protein
LFAGIRNVTFGELGVTNESLKNRNIAAIPRTGGAQTSGTTDAFINDHNLPVDKKDPRYENAYGRLRTGNFDKFVLQTSNEANQQAYAKVRGTNYSMSYVSYGFSSKQESKDIKTASYRNPKTDSDVYPTAKNFQNGSYG